VNCTNESNRLRSVRFGSVRFDSIRFASLRFVSIRFASLRFGSVRFGSVRFGSVRFGSVRVILVFIKLAVLIGILQSFCVGAIARSLSGIRARDGSGLECCIELHCNSLEVSERIVEGA